MKSSMIISTLKGHTGNINVIQFIPNTSFVVTGSSDATLLAFDHMGKCFSKFEGHSKAVLGLSMHSNGKVMATASADFTVQIWFLLLLLLFFFFVFFLFCKGSNLVQFSQALPPLWVSVSYC